LKNIAEYVTTDVNDNGIYNAMKHYKLIWFERKWFKCMTQL
jgi:hypothetical protein